MVRLPGPAWRFIGSVVVLGALTGATLAGRVTPGRAQPAEATATAPGASAQQPSFTDEPQNQPIDGTPGLPPPEAEQVVVTNTPTRTPTPINIGNFVWDDLDKDGRQDAGEPGLPGITVQLWNSAKTQLLDSDVTDANGRYTVVAPLPGDYRIRVLLASAQDQFSPKDQAGGDDQLDSDINPSGTSFGFTDSFTLASNVISTTTYDAGIIVFRLPTPTRTPTPINIGNFVWVDLDADGIQDAGEPGLGGVTVQLWNADRTQLIDSDETSASGAYTVVAPLPGDYRIRVLLPSGAGFAPKDTGADDQKDSDINRNLLLNTFGFSDAFTLASNVISTTIYDAGLINVPSTATPSRTPTGPTATMTRTPTATSMPAELDQQLYLPLLRQ